VEGERELFAELQRRLRELAPQLTIRGIEHEAERTLVVVNSMSVPVPAWVTPLLPAYEERFLCLVLALLRQPSTHVVYVTSQPVHPRLIDYWFRLVPRLDREDARRRGTFIALSDSSFRPLTAKMLERPRLLERIKQQIVAPERSLILPFVVTDLERRLAVELGIPVYGPDPDLSRFGTKTGSRRVFADVGVPLPLGFEELTGLRDVVRAIEEIRARRPACRQVIVKLDDSVSGLGNGLVTLGAGGEASARSIALEDSSISADEFYELVAERGAIAEERIVGEGFCSPSVQLRVRPDGEIEVLSTHDQILGGPSGQVYVGCRLPADPGYAVEVGRHGHAIAEHLRDAGVIGRFAVDFVAVRENGSWSPYAVEINLRNGGTSHPLITLAALTDGSYDAEAGVFRSRMGRVKHYVATDDLEADEYRRLTPDDLLDVALDEHLVWDEEVQVGVAFHMVSALAVAGRVGMTAIGDTPEEAQALYDRAAGIVDAAAR
jgi:PGM1 C-terminal domain